MALFDMLKKNGGLMDVIRCDEPSYLIWKWHPSGSQSRRNNREDAIRWGSSLRVKDGEVAVFVYKQKNGTMQDYIEGPFDQTIKTANFPVLASIVGLAYDGKSPFQAEVYFINLARIIQVRFAVPFFEVYDPRFLDFGVPVAVRGTISFRISDYREFIKLHRLSSFSLDDLQKQIRDVVSRYIKNVVANAPSVNNIPVIQLESKTAVINDAIEHDLGVRLKTDFGVDVSGIDIGTIEIDKSSSGYRQLMAVTKDTTTATVQAQTAANIQDIHDRQRIEAENYAETLRIQREESQYAQRKQTQSANFAAFQTETQADVAKASADAFGQMNANGAGNVNMGGDMGFNPAAMMAGVTMGSAMGQNVANMMNSAMSGMRQPVQPGSVPPPVPTVAYYVVINGQAAGPYDKAVLLQMAQGGDINKDSLVWKQGMADWAYAGTVAELSAVFTGMPTIPPV